MESIFCSSVVKVEIEGEIQDIGCTMNAGHPESHSAKIWWSDDA